MSVSVSEELLRRALDTNLIDAVEFDRMRHGLPAPSSDPTWPLWACPVCRGHGHVAIDFQHRRLVPAPERAPESVVTSINRTKPVAAAASEPEPEPEPEQQTEEDTA